MSERFGAIGTPVEPFEAIWSHVEPNGAIWGHLESLHWEPFCAIRSRLEPFWGIVEQVGAV